ncbi:unnamed protein product [Phaedon cochleariae]|uniref:Ribosome biogenesis protein NOP53 n=1 Tax=Phaedon cochleariae TaxID=80249 RepID=A0A9P0DQA7_PHACE|nr:unnamed protein product [Phaedon cochleariae]
MAISGTKKKKVSKKLKSSWRKHVNIKDVEEFLEDQRLDERLGPPLATISNDELFKVDVKPDEQLLSSKERRKLKALKPLKCLSSLESYTKVPDPIAKRNHVRTKEERMNRLVMLKKEANQKKGIFTAKEIQAKANRELAEVRRQNKPKRGEFSEDLWAGVKKFPIESDEWATTNTKKHNLRGVGVPIKNVRPSLKEKKSGVPAIEAPHPGMSYNPSYKDHQDLLRAVAEKESKLIKEEAHLQRCTRGMFSKVTEETRDHAWLVEMSEGLPSKEGTNVEENEASGDEYKSVNPPTKNQKKTLKQRRKQKEQLDLAKARRTLKVEKKKITDIHQLKVLARQVSKIERQQAIIRGMRAKVKELKKNEPKVLGSMKYEEPDLEFNMMQDIAGNLKDLKTEGSLLADRFKSMQKRNILAPTKRHARKKAKVKKYTKPGHKDEDWKKTVAR